MLTRFVRLILVSAAMMVAAVAAAGPALAVPPTSTSPNAGTHVDTPPHCIFTGDILITWTVGYDGGFSLDQIVAPEATYTAVMDSPNGPLIVVTVPSGSTSAPVTLTFKPSGSFTIPPVTEPFPASCTPEARADFVSKCGRLADITFHNDINEQLTFRTHDGFTETSHNNVQPGKSLLLADFPVPASGKVSVNVDVPPIDSPSLFDVPLKTFTWTEPSNGCASPSPQPPAAAPQLPITGAHVSGVLVVGVALVGFGVLFVVGSALVWRRRTLTD